MIINISSIIAITSLAVSFTGLYFSIKKSKNDKKLVPAQKRTELLKKIIDSRFRLQKNLSKVNEMKVVWETCNSRPKDKLVSIEENVIKSIKAYDNYSALLDGFSDEADPLALESLIPAYYELSLNIEDVFTQTIDVIQGCHSCQQKSSL